MIVIFDPKKTTPRRTGPIAFDRIQLKPGANDLSESAVDTLKSHPDFDAYVESGAVVLKAEKTEKPEPPAATRKPAPKGDS